MIEMYLSRIKRLAVHRESENIRFRSFLKGMDGRKIDLIVHSLHKEVIAQVDCLLCGNCCSCLSPEVNDNDLKTLAGREDMLPEEYLSVYCKEESGIFF
jgi:hypothetical protein